MLEVQHLTKKYGKVTANGDLCFSLPEGSITVMLGPNGAGKSTALKSIVGLLKYQGMVRVDVLHNKSVEAKRLLGYVPELPALYPNLTVSEHLEFIARVYRLQDYRGYAEELLERMELADKRRKFGDELSKGMQQKLSICCALLTRPKYLLFDEPMIGLDPHAIKELKTVFAEQRAAGGALLISTHIIDSVDDLWNRALIMQNGHILEETDATALAASGETLEERFFRLTETPSDGTEEA